MTARPAYVLDGIPLAVRQAISVAAAESNMSLADTIRVALCSHYQLECPPIGRGYEEARDEGATRMVLRVEPMLFEKIKNDAGQQGQTMKAVILDVLERRFGEETS